MARSNARTRFLLPLCLGGCVPAPGIETTTSSDEQADAELQAECDEALEAFDPEQCQYGDGLHLSWGKSPSAFIPLDEVAAFETFEHGYYLDPGGREGMVIELHFQNELCTMGCAFRDCSGAPECRITYENRGVFSQCDVDRKGVQWCQELAEDWE